MSTVTVEKTKKYLVVKIPLGAVENGRAEISSRSQKIIDGAIKMGLRDIEAGKTFGPFSSVGEFRRALKSSSRK